MTDIKKEMDFDFALFSGLAVACLVSVPQMFYYLFKGDNIGWIVHLLAIIFFMILAFTFQKDYTKNKVDLWWIRSREKKK